jgi:hypothetical protein
MDRAAEIGRFRYAGWAGGGAHAIATNGRQDELDLQGWVWILFWIGDGDAPLKVSS